MKRNEGRGDRGRNCMPKKMQKERGRKPRLREKRERGSCSVCGRAVGGSSGLAKWCPRCRKIFCKACCPTGLVFKKLVCPECGTELL